MTTATSTRHKTLNFGSTEVLYDRSGQYSILIRFRITPAGADFLTAADAETSVGWEAGWFMLHVASGVQALADGAANREWRMLPVAGNSNANPSHSSQYSSDLSLRPWLTSTYSLPSQQ